jgi:cyclopropane fatty-acyl-phospholipid synthase-like methyltransferase
VPTVEELYGELWAEDAALRAELDCSLDPRPVESLYDAFAGLGVRAGDVVLDVGCRDAIHSVGLARRFGCEVVAADLIPGHLEKARERIAKEGLEGQIRIVEAPIESLPLGDEAVDHVWCRDVLNHVRLPEALAECARVLRRGGRMLVYQTFATELLEPREAERLFSAVAIVPENMSRSHFETTARDAGFAIASVDEIGSEWREHGLETGKGKTVDDLLRVARLRRREAEVVERYGRASYEAALWGSIWGVYQLLGKLCPTVYVLARRDG